MNYPESFVAVFKASDFKDADYMDNYNCPLARALKRSFPHDKETEQIFVGGNKMAIEVKGPNSVNGDNLAVYKFDGDEWCCTVMEKLQRLAKNKEKVSLSLVLTYTGIKW